MPADPRLDDVFDSVADGTPIDWNALDSQATDANTRELLEQLRIVAGVAGAHRSVVDDSGTVDIPTSEDRTRTATAPVLARESTANQWGRYELVEKLGRGTYGTVYRAWDSELERFLAIKLIHPLHGLKDSARMRVLKEGRAIAKVSHPNVVAVHGVEVHDDQVGLCMELVKGKTLDEIVKKQGRLGAHEATTIGQAVCRALAAVHAANLVHRDVKARNVMREDGGRIVLMDFGAGQVLSDQPGVERRGAAGTPIYMAPETLAGAEGSIASDIYSTGVLLFYLVTGRYPYEGSTPEEVARAHARGERHYVTEHRPDLPVSFVRAVEKALDPNPALRQNSTAALLFDLLRGDSEHVVPEPGPSPWQHVRHAVPRNTARVISFFGLSLVIAFMLGFFNSWAYTYSLGVDSSFLHEGLLSDVKWGYKSMVAPVVLMTIVWLLALIAIEVVKLVRRVSVIADYGLRRAGNALTGFVQRMGYTPSSALACALIALSLVFIVWVRVWRFDALLSAMLTPIEDASNDALFLLSPANVPEQGAYRQILSLAVLGMIAGWITVLRMASRRHERLKPVLIGAGVAATFIMVVMLDFPYRLLWHNESEKAVFNGQACYVLGYRNSDVRLFCPGGKPQTMAVQASDPKFTRLGTEESIFTAFSRLRH